MKKKFNLAYAVILINLYGCNESNDYLFDPPRGEKFYESVVLVEKPNLAKFCFRMNRIMNSNGFQKFSCRENVEGYHGFFARNSTVQFVFLQGMNNEWHCFAIQLNSSFKTGTRQVDYIKLVQTIVVSELELR